MEKNMEKWKLWFYRGCVGDIVFYLGILWYPLLSVFLLGVHGLVISGCIWLKRGCRVIWGSIGAYQVI